MFQIVGRQNEVIMMVGDAVKVGCFSDEVKTSWLSRMARKCPSFCPSALPDRFQREHALVQTSQGVIDRNFSGVTKTPARATDLQANLIHNLSTKHLLGWH